MLKKQENSGAPQEGGKTRKYSQRPGNECGIWRSSSIRKRGVVLVYTGPAINISELRTFLVKRKSINYV
jgi:hypothetical protein